MELFMGSEASGSIHNPDHTFPPYFPKMRYNIIFPSMLKSSACSLQAFR